MKRLVAAVAIFLMPIVGMADMKSPEQLRDEALSSMAAHIHGDKPSLRITLAGYLDCRDPTAADTEVTQCVRRYIKAKGAKITGDLPSALEAASEAVRGATLGPLREAVQ